MRRLAALGLLAALPLTPAPAHAALSITVPGPVITGSSAPGAEVEIPLGQVRVEYAGLLDTAGFTSQVSLTAPFSLPNNAYAIPALRTRYWSGPPAAAGGGPTLGLCVGQPTALAAVVLTAPRTAMTCPAQGLTSYAVAWSPTVVVQTVSGDPAGSYTATITHSVS